MELVECFQFWQWRLAHQCMSAADKVEQEEATLRSVEYRAWAKKATADGGGAAHAYAKVPTGWRAALVPDGLHPGRGLRQSSEVQGVVDSELSKWANGP